MLHVPRGNEALLACLYFSLGQEQGHQITQQSGSVGDGDVGNVLEEERRALDAGDHEILQRRIRGGYDVCGGAAQGLVEQGCKQQKLSELKSLLISPPSQPPEEVEGDRGQGHSRHSGSQGEPN